MKLRKRKQKQKISKKIRSLYEHFGFTGSLMAVVVMIAGVYASIYWMGNHQEVARSFKGQSEVEFNEMTWEDGRGLEVVGEQGRVVEEEGRIEYVSQEDVEENWLDRMIRLMAELLGLKD